MKYLNAFAFILVFTLLCSSCGTPAPAQSNSTTQPLRQPNAPLSMQGQNVPATGEPISVDNLDKLMQLSRWGAGSFNALTWSGDGQLIATAGSLGVSIFEAATLKERRFSESPNFLYSLALSPDGSLLFGGGDGSSIFVWRVADGALTQTLTGSTRDIRALALSADGNQIVHAGIVPSFGLIARQEPGASARKVFSGHTERVRAVAISPDGSLVASGSDDQTVRIWRAREGTPVRSLTKHEGAVTQLAFNQDGRLLATGSQDGTVRFWRVSDGVLIRMLDSGPRKGTQAISFGSGLTIDSALAVFANGNDSLAILRANNEAPRIMQVTAAPWPDLRISPDQTRLAVLSRSETLTVYDMADGKSLAQVKHDLGLERSVAISPDDQLLVTGATDGAAYVWQLSNGLLQRVLSGHTGAVESVAFSPDGTLIATGSSDQSVMLWRAGDGTLLRTLKGHEGSVHAIAFSADSTSIASASQDRTIKLWRVSDGTLLRTVSGSPAPIWSVAFNAQGTLLMSGDASGEVRLWRVSDRTKLQALSYHTGSVRSLALSADGHWAATGTQNDEFINFWRVQDESLSLVRKIGADKTGVSSLQFNSDSTLLAMGGTDGSLHFFRVSNGESLGALAAHHCALQSLRFAPSNQWLATTGCDFTLRLWGIP